MRLIDCEACGHSHAEHGLNATDTIRPCRMLRCDCPDYLRYADEDDEETIADAEAHREDWQDYLEFQRTSH